MTPQEAQPLMLALSSKIQAGVAELAKRSREYAEAERTYRKGKALQWQQAPAGTVPEKQAWVDAQSADLRYARDLADGLRDTRPGGVACPPSGAVGPPVVAVGVQGRGRVDSLRPRGRGLMVESNVRTNVPRRCANTPGPADWIGVDVTDDTCAVDGCETPRRKRGWCSSHYDMWRRYGDPCAPKRKLPNGAAPETCTLDGCDQPYHAGGYCSQHYGTAKRHGSPIEPRPYGDLWAKVDKTGDCWHWTGSLHTNGYGCHAQGQAHRVVYEEVVGPIPDGLDLDHVCHNVDPTCPGGHECMHRRCVNPDHLEPVDRGTNMLRANARVPKPTHCSIDGCDRERHARGMCGTHYSRWYHGRALS